MATNVVPTLSTQGYVSEPNAKIDFLLSHFFVAENSQSYLYYGEVSSLPWIIQQGTNDMGKTIAMMQSQLQIYLGAYYDEVRVEVTSVLPLDENPEIKIDLRIQLDLLDKGVREQFARQLLAENGKFQELIDLNNGPEGV